MEFSNIVLTNFIRNTIKYHKLLQNGDKVVLGVSGGIDSLAFMHILHNLQQTLKFQLYIATLDHGLRGEQGANDVEYVKSLATNWQISYFSDAVDVTTLADKQKLSIETAARNARYAFFARIARQVGTTKIAVAHHADDQAETILMHLLRGSGLQGLQGMQLSAPVPNHPDLTLIRPLLNVTRAQLEAYCNDNDLVGRFDETNADTQYLRNLLRLEIMPALTRVNPQLTASLGRLSENVSVDLMYIQEQFTREILPHIKRNDGQVGIPRTSFTQCHPALQRRSIIYAVEQLKPHAPLTHYHITEAVRIAINGNVGALTQFPDGLRLRVDYDYIIIEIYNQEQSFPADEFLLSKDAEIAISRLGTTIIEDIQGKSWQFIASNSIRINHCHAQLSIPSSSKIKLRTRKAGDRFKPLGLNGHTKKLKDWMIDQKIPQYLRDHIPILEINGNVGAILRGKHWFIADTFKISKESQRNVCFLVHNS